MRKKIIGIFLIGTFLLTGCFGGGDDESGELTTENGKIIYEKDNFSINVPQDWEIIEEKQFPTSVPNELIVAFQNNIRSEIFTANVAVAKKTFEEPISSEDYAKESKRTIRNQLVSFKDISSDSVDVNFNDEAVRGIILDLEGRRSATEAIVHFKQLYITNDLEAFTITGSYLPNEDETIVKTIEEMLNSFALN